jgi:protein involved in polysaccharide export with SLBB domain
VIAGGTIAGSVTTDGVQISTVRTNAATALTDAATAQSAANAAQSTANAALPAASFDSTLDASLAAGVGYVISGEGGDYRLNVGASSVVARHRYATNTGIATDYATGDLKAGLILTATGLAMGYNRRSDGAWVNAVAIDSTGNASLKGSLSVADLTAGTISAEITSTNNVILSTAGKLYTAGKTSAASISVITPQP